MAKKMTRTKIRENLYIMLFRMDFYDVEGLELQAEMYLEDLEEASETEKEELKKKFHGIIEHVAEIDAKIEDKANGWTLKRLAKADLTVLRLAVYEILFDEQVPNRVAINEAVELSRLYGGDKSPRFVNGVLASIVKELPEEEAIL